MCWYFVVQRDFSVLIFSVRDVSKFGCKQLIVYSPDTANNVGSHYDHSKYLTDFTQWPKPHQKLERANNGGRYRSHVIYLHLLLNRRVKWIVEWSESFIVFKMTRSSSEVNRRVKWIITVLQMQGSFRYFSRQTRLKNGNCTQLFWPAPPLPYTCLRTSHHLNSTRIPSQRR